MIDDLSSNEDLISASSAVIIIIKLRSSSCDKLPFIFIETVTLNSYVPQIQL